ncbi:ABC transporter ATP-binding protein [Actinomyces wuliandei]|uniref:ABC transporter ATP-binding protein n=1 Tax=Actinomyces wuliandei TaxID=2057743 RepID=UPI000FDB39EB|nr:ABC transporter ATP-binding protein [Actinomyces wuliandei]
MVHIRRRAELNVLFGHVISQRTTVSVVVVMSMVSAGLSLAQPILVRELIGRVSNSSPLGILPFCLGIMVVIGGVVGGVLQYLIQRTAETAIRMSRYRVIDHILRLPAPQIDRRRVGDLVSRVSNDTTTIRNMLSQGLVESIAGLFTLAGAIVAMVLIDLPLFAAAAAGAAVCAIIVVIAATRRIEMASIDLQNALGRLTASMDRAVRAIRTIRAANATRREASRVKGEVDNVWRVGLRVARTTALVAPVSSVAMHVSLLVVLGLGGLRVAAGVLAVADLVSFIMFLFLLIMPLGQLFGTIVAVGEALGGAAKIAEIIGIQREDIAGNTGSGGGARFYRCYCRV